MANGAADDRGTLAMPSSAANSLRTGVRPRRKPDTVADQLDRAMQAGRIGTWHLDLDTGVVTVSSQCKANFGLPATADFTAERGMQAIPEEDRSRVQAALDAAAAGASEYDIEHRVIWPDGSLHWIHARGRSGADRGQPRRLSGVTVDITRPRRAEALALMQNALLERVALGHPRAECLAAVNQAIEALDPRVRGCFVMADPRRTRVIEVIAPFPPDVIEHLFAMPIGQASFGTCSAAIFHGRPFASHDIANDDAWHAQWRGLCLTQDVRSTYSVPVLRPDDGRAVGSFCLCLGEARAPDEWELQIAQFGAHIASLLVERDRVVNALQTGEAQLAAELADARTLHEVSVELMAEDDVSVIYRKIIDAACLIMHSQFASLQMRHGSRLQLLAHHGFTPRAVEAWRWLDAACSTSCGQAFDTGRRVIYTDVRTMADHIGAEQLEHFRETGIVAVQTTPLKSRSGRVVGMLSTHWAYPHHPSEHELRLLDILARLAADLIERRQADWELRESDRRKDEFLAMLGHELRNPLAPLRNALHILRMEGTTGNDNHALYEMMDRQMTQLVRLVDDLLEVSRITRGHIELRRRHTALSDVVTTAVETSQPLLDGFGHRFSVDLPADPIVLDVDPIRIAQVLSNLLNNAAKYTPAGGNVALHARIVGDHVRIGVRDDGAGIDPRQHAQIFELFAQGMHTRRQSRGGLGIGLTLARDLVRLHGGTITVQSEGIGKGSEFVVELPPPDTRAAVQEPPANTIAPSEQPRRVLIVDDNVAHAESLARLLALGRHETHTCYDGYEALSTFETLTPDIVLLDLGMPGMDGYELCRRIRTSATGRDTVIIAVSGWGQQTDRDRSAAFGFDDHLIKPVNAHDILHRLEMR
ncbi:hybrid sensor histidine kinase/response regulator [Lysobacter terrae]